MSDEVMEALNSETSSESESDSVKSPMKGSKPQSPSPRKPKIASPITNENSNSSSDIPLSSIVTKKRTKLAIMSEADAESSTDTEKQNIKPYNMVVPIDENSSSSDVLLAKLASSTEYKSSEKKKESNHIPKKAPSNRSKKNNKSKLLLISDDSDMSPVEQVDSDSNLSGVGEIRELPKSNAKKRKSEKVSEKKSLKRKRSGETDKDQVQAKTKRKLNITSDSSSDDAVETKSVTLKPTPNKREGRPASTKKNETVQATIDHKSSPPKSKSKPGPVSSKKNNSSVENGITVSPTKTAHSSDFESPKPVDDKKGKKFSKNDILKKLDSSSNTSSSSEDSDEVEDISNVEPSSSSSESDEDSDVPLSSSKGKKKVLQQRKSNGTTKSESSASHSDNPLPSKNKTKANSDETEKLSDDGTSSGSSSSEDDSENVPPKKKKVMQKAEKTSKKESLKDKRHTSASDSDDPLPSKNKTKASSGEAEDHGEPSSGSSSSENESENVSPKKKKTQEKDEKTSKIETVKEKRKPGDNPRIVRLQRYLKEAGIRVQNYKTLWQNCKSDKARAEKLMDLLRERGLKGKPSVSECRKLKKKFEREKEVSELNTSNIITSNGRSRRGVTSLFATRRSTSPSSAKKQEMSPKKSPEFKKVFGRLKNIVDSEESD